MVENLEPRNTSTQIGLLIFDKSKKAIMREKKWCFQNTGKVVFPYAKKKKKLDFLMI
jgi:hypothetical protein